MAPHVSMPHLHVHCTGRCGDKPAARLLSAHRRPSASSVRSIHARAIALRAFALSRAILAAPKTSDNRASHGPRLIGNSRSVLASDIMCTRRGRARHTCSRSHENSHSESLDEPNPYPPYAWPMGLSVSSIYTMSCTMVQYTIMQCHLTWPWAILCWFNLKILVPTDT